MYNINIFYLGGIMGKKLEGLVYLIVHLLIVACFILGIVLDPQWTAEKGKNSAIQLDKVFERVEDGDVVFFRGILPEHIGEGDIGYYSSHADSYVYIDGVEVYANVANRTIFKSTGYCWNSVDVVDGSGKEVVIQLVPNYGNSVPVKDVKISYGSQKELLMDLLDEEGFHFGISVAILLVGFVLAGYAILFSSEDRGNSSTRVFAVFTILLGAYYMCDSRLIALPIRFPLVLNLITHITLMIMPSVFVRFMRHNFMDSNHICWRIYMWFNTGVIGVRSVLQLLGVKDLRETLILTHISLGILTVTCIGMCIREIKSGKITKDMRNILISVVVIMLAMSFDMIIFEMRGVSGSAGVLGFLIYSIMMGVHSTKRSKKIYERYKETEIYRQLAYTDELTGLFNRTAYQKDIEGDKLQNTAVVMMDMNDLKKCNDKFGHDCGDRYIIKIAEVIQETFGEVGKCYRIGGDEFCTIIHDAEETRIEKLLMILQRNIAEINREGFEVLVALACGYKMFDEKVDHSLEDTLKRADKDMYKEKKQMKENK